MRDETDSENNQTPALKRDHLAAIASEILERSVPSERIMPDRLFTRPDNTHEHLITEAELTKLENCGNNTLRNKAYFFLGGALSTIIPSFAIIWNYFYPSLNSTSATIVDIFTIVIFFICLGIGSFLYKEASNPSNDLEKACDDIRKRPAKKFVE